MVLKQYTNRLIDYLYQLNNRFHTEEPPASMSDRNLFEQMKKETTPIHQTLEKWERLALTAIHTNKISLHPQQIHSTKENIQLIILHSYYIDVRKRIYMEYYQSSIYILKNILTDLNDHVTKGDQYET